MQAIIINFFIRFLSVKWLLICLICLFLRCKVKHLFGIEASFLNFFSIQHELPRIEHEFSGKEDLKNALGRTAIPAVWQGTVLPLAGNESGDGFTQTVGILAHEDVGADGDRLLMLGVVIDSDAGDTIEGGLFGYVARVGDDALGMGGEPAELKVIQRVYS